MPRAYARPARQGRNQHMGSSPSPSPLAVGRSPCFRGVCLHQQPLVSKGIRRSGTADSPLVAVHQPVLWHSVSIPGTCCLPRSAGPIKLKAEERFGDKMDKLKLQRHCLKMLTACSFPARPFFCRGGGGRIDRFKRTCLQCKSRELTDSSRFAAGCWMRSESQASSVEEYQANVPATGHDIGRRPFRPATPSMNDCHAR